MDLAEERAPLLYLTPGRPPLDAWDLQIAAPAPLVAWLEARRRRGQQSGIYGVGVQGAIATIAAEFPRVPLSSEHHFDSTRYPYSHVHVLLAAEDLDGRPVEREQLQQVADQAWIAHIDRMVDYARERPHLGLQWLPDGSIAGIDHTNVPTFTCSELDWLDREPIVSALRQEELRGSAPDPRPHSDRSGPGRW